MPQTVIEQQTDSLIPPKRKRNTFSSQSAAAAVAIREAKRKAQAQPIQTPVDDTQLVEHSYKSSRINWAGIEAKFRKDITRAQKTGDQKGIVALVTAAAIAHDKAFKKQEDQQPLLSTPQMVIDNLLKLISPSRALVGSNPTTPDKPIDTPGCEPLPLSES